MRVLHIVGQSHRRGAEIAAMELARELDALGHENHVVAIGLGHDGERDPDLPALTHRSDSGPRAALMSTLPLRRVLRRDPVDLILAHGAAAASTAAFARRRNAPLLVWQRILGFPSNAMRPGRRQWHQFVARRTDAVVALTTNLAEETRRLGFAGPVWIIGNSRAPGRFIHVNRVEAAARLHREIGVEREVPLLGFVGHLVAQKRPERTLDVLERVLAAGQPAHLVVAGSGPLRRRVEKEVSERGLSADVSLLGHRSDIEQVYGGLDLLVLTSDAEGIPGVALEAQLSGCPLVTFPLGGMGGVVEDGRTGVVLDRADTPLMAEQVIRLLEHPELRQRMGVEGRGRAEEFSMRRAAAEYSARFEELDARLAALRA